ncbi:type II toxin-antitoxin system RelE/ParE family toxin [Sorangium sp. So ce233]|uniref:type II toxin-antitoxin system RelE/ParE family toxin n=1 Tax=Sorangium sp. So ce233 TaxID=3133290 RepID=UPI003F610AB9
MSRVVFLAEARAEALETFRWYEEQRSGLGAVFRRELDDAIKRIQDAPLAYPPRYLDIRRILVERLPYAVFYRILPDAIVVAGVIHGRRHPRA